MAELHEILELLRAAAKIEQAVETIVKSIKTEVDKEKDVKKRKKIHRAVDNRDGKALRDAWFDI